MKKLTRRDWVLRNQISPHLIKNIKRSESLVRLPTPELHCILGTDSQEHGATAGIVRSLGIENISVSEHSQFWPKK
jgi:hypothetical protein